MEAARDRHLGRRLIGWSAFVVSFAALAYGSRAVDGKPDRNVLYTYDNAVGGIVGYAIILSIALAIAWGLSARDAFAFRRPHSWAQAIGLAVAIYVGILLLGGIVDQFADPGREQGLTPTHWEPSRAGAFVANAFVVGAIAPVVEEMTFRGIGYSLLERFGRPTAIVVVGIAFGLVHGLVIAFPILAAFGAGLAYLRSRTGSIYPAMLLHAAFNLVALVLAVS